MAKKSIISTQIWTLYRVKYKKKIKYIKVRLMDFQFLISLKMSNLMQNPNIPFFLIIEMTPRFILMCLNIGMKPLYLINKNIYLWKINV
jgi:hypothetical protein